MRNISQDVTYYTSVATLNGVRMPYPGAYESGKWCSPYLEHLFTHVEFQLRLMRSRIAHKLEHSFYQVRQTSMLTAFTVRKNRINRDQR